MLSRKHRLFEPVERGEIEVIRWLLERGANLEAKDNDGYTPLHRAKNDKMKQLLRTYREEEARRRRESERRKASHAKVLGLSGRVSKDAIRKAYRRQAAQYHPDKVAHPAKEFREIAARKILRINEAYDYFRQKIFTLNQISHKRWKIVATLKVRYLMTRGREKYNL